MWGQLTSKMQQATTKKGRGQNTVDDKELLEKVYNVDSALALSLCTAIALSLALTQAAFSYTVFVVLKPRARAA